MFCEECGQHIAFDPRTGKLYHTSAATYPELNDHEPRMCETDRKRHEARQKARS